MLNVWCFALLNNEQLSSLYFFEYNVVSNGCIKWSIVICKKKKKKSNSPNKSYLFNDIYCNYLISRTQFNKKMYKKFLCIKTDLKKYKWISKAWAEQIKYNLKQADTNPRNFGAQFKNIDVKYRIVSVHAECTCSSEHYSLSLKYWVIFKAVLCDNLRRAIRPTGCWIQYKVHKLHKRTHYWVLHYYNLQFQEFILLKLRRGFHIWYFSALGAFLPPLCLQRYQKQSKAIQMNRGKNKSSQFWISQNKTWRL